jgi:cytoskeletal protein CcmA (bactofilin family)
VFGHVTGNLSATEKVEIRESGSVDGDIVAPRVAIADGSNFRGSIDMQRKEQPGSTDGAVEALDRPARAPKLVAASVTDELVRV